MLKNLFLLFFVPLTLFAQGDQPEGESGFETKQAVFAKHMMVSSANPFASQAGLAILKKGGNALDAAIAMQWVLNVVEPQSSGLGGGAFLLYYDKKKNQVLAYDGREAAPQGVNEEWFLDAQKKPLPHSTNIVGGRSVGVPGLLKMLERAHQEKGHLPWKELFSSAILLAEQGFPISPRLQRLIETTPTLAHSPAAVSYLFSKKAGEILKNPELAHTLRLLAEQGSVPFYEGEIAQELIRVVQQGGGAMTLKDLARYEAKLRTPLVTPYKDYLICGFPPPASGGIVLAQILTMLAHHSQNTTELDSVAFIDFFSSASRLAYADRDYYIADPDFFPVPQERLLNITYLQKRAEEAAKRINASPGKYPGNSLACCSPMLLSSELEFPSTTHLCVVDQEGNSVSMTSSIEHAFGSTLMAAGFFLNNELTDFSMVPEKGGKKAANRVEGGKRPMSSMTPTLVFKKGSGALYLTVGSAGGGRIVDYVAKTVLGVLDFRLNVQQAISAPNFASTTTTIDLEKGTSLAEKAPALEKLGNSVTIIPLTSGTQGIQVVTEGLLGGADPRREGVALGE